MQALQQQDFRALVDNHPKAIMLATREPRILYVNEKFRSVTGYRSDEVLGQPPSVLSSGLHSREFYQSMWRAIGHKGRWEGLVWNRRKNGETYPQWLMIYPVEHENHRFYAGVFMDVGDMTADDERLASLAYYDPLTELPNRALFQEFLKARVSQRAKDGQAFAVLYIDLDFFKSVNDLHGHDCGDRVLQQAALCIQSVLRRGDVVARLSGDEFAAIIELRNDDDLESVCQRMVQSFRAPVIVDHREYFLSSSVGAAVYPDHGSQASELLQNADRAMYAAKLAGRACFRIYDAVDTEQGRQAELLPPRYRQDGRAGGTSALDPPRIRCRVTCRFCPDRGTARPYPRANGAFGPLHRIGSLRIPRLISPWSAACSQYFGPADHGFPS